MYHRSGMNNFRGEKTKNRTGSRSLLVDMDKTIQLWNEKKYNNFIQCLPPFLTMFVATAKYLNVIINMEQVIKLLVHIKQDSKRWEKQPEGRIYRELNIKGRLYVSFFATYATIGVALYLALPIYTAIIETVNRGNSSEPRTLLYQADYHVDQEKYFFWITLHAYYLTIMSIALIVALDALYIIAIHHSCIQFTVVGFKLRTAHIVNKNILYRDNAWQKLDVVQIRRDDQEQVYQNIVHCVGEHGKALEYVNLLQSTFSTTLFIQIGLNIVCLSISAVEMLLYLDQIDIALGMGSWLAGQLFHLFMLCLPGQRLSNSSEDVYYNALECMWYLCFSKSVVVYQFFLQNTLTPRQLVAMKLTVLNMETFQAVTRLAASYFTVLSSTL